MKHQLLKKVSKIHSVKCYKSSDFNEAVSSYIKLTELAENIKQMDEDNNENIESINSEIKSWQKSKPVVNDSEI